MCDRRNKKVSRLCHFYRQSRYFHQSLCNWLARNFSDLSSGRRDLPPFSSRARGGFTARKSHVAFEGYPLFKFLSLSLSHFSLYARKK